MSESLQHDIALVRVGLGWMLLSESGAQDYVEVKAALIRLGEALGIDAFLTRATPGESP